MSADRVLILGSYPPIPVPGSAVTVEEVRRAWAAGFDVTVVSPRLSAAHLSVPVSGLLAGRRLDNVRRTTGCRRLVMVAEDGFPFATVSSWRQRLAGRGLAAAMNRFDHVRLVRVGGHALPAGAATRVISAADEMEEAHGAPAAPGVTPLGPPEVALREQPARLAGAAAHRLLGERYPLFRARAAALRRRVRRPTSGPAGG